jgi:hypothetical protein
MDARSRLFRYGTMLLLAIAGGFCGSVLHDWVKGQTDVVRARRYEVLGPAGKVLSYWGPDDSPRIQPGTPKGIILVFVDPSGVRRAQFGTGLGSYVPELLFFGKEGLLRNGPPEISPEPRFSVGLGYDEDPFLTMRSRNGWRVLLGAAHGDAPSPGDDDWGISFVTRTGANAYVGTHGVNPGASQAFVTVRDDKGQSWSVPPQFHYEIEKIPIAPRSRK